jgi:hypothetical protein
MVFLTIAKTLYEVSFVTAVPIVATTPALSTACGMWRHPAPECNSRNARHLPPIAGGARDRARVRGRQCGGDTRGQQQ